MADHYAGANYLSSIVERFASRVPMSQRHAFARMRFRRFMRRELGRFFREVDEGPVGDREIVLGTSILREERIPTHTDPDYYFYSGYTGMLSWLRLLKAHSFNLRTASSIMEIGCGSARLIRHLRCIDGARLLGTDVKPEFIDWCRRHVPGIEFHVNDLYPPMSFAESDSMDLVFANSVFTHVPLEAQQPWIEELHRILRPGGFVVLNVLGREHEELMLSPADREELRRVGELTLDADDPRVSFSSRLVRSWDVFQVRWKVLEAFGSVFDVEDYLPDSLDVLVLRKPRAERVSTRERTAHVPPALPRPPGDRAGPSPAS